MFGVYMSLSVSTDMYGSVRQYLSSFCFQPLQDVTHKPRGPFNNTLVATVRSLVVACIFASPND